MCGDTSRGRRLYWRTEDVQDMEQDKEQHEKQVRLRTLSESVDRVNRTRRNWRSGGYRIHTSGGGRLPDLVSFSSKFAWIRDMFFHQVSSDVWR